MAGRALHRGVFALERIGRGAVALHREGRRTETPLVVAAGAVGRLPLNGRAARMGVRRMAGGTGRRDGVAPLVTGEVAVASPAGHGRVSSFERETGAAVIEAAAGYLLKAPGGVAGGAGGPEAAFVHVFVAVGAAPVGNRLVDGDGMP